MTQNRQLGSCSAISESQARLMEILDLSCRALQQLADGCADWHFY